MKTIGITGQSGFIGSFLKNYIKFFEHDLKIVEFDDDFFTHDDKLRSFVKKCDIVVHLAGMSRGDDKEVYDTNVRLATELIGAFEASNVAPQLFFASSIHEKTDNGFGRAKKESRILFSKWAKQNNARFVGLIIPHVFGPFGKPFHNSALATFCHQLTSGQKPKVLNDSELKLVYVEQLTQKIVTLIKAGQSNSRIDVKPDRKIMVSDLLEKLEYFKLLYLKDNIIPPLKDDFETNLFNTFRSYINDQDRAIAIEKHQDNRGYFCEMTKTKSAGGQFSFSASNKGVERGNHFHTRKIERFCVIKGNARIKIRKVGERKAQFFTVSGEKPVIIDIPIWYAHNIKNVSPEPLLTLFYSNEIFDKHNPDTFEEKA